jgi:MFS transporter, ACS family, glucarate transporter
MATSLIICNYVDAYWLVILVIALSFFGKGILSSPHRQLATSA